MGNLCLDGYARGTCPHFPSDESTPDAIELTAACETSETITIRYSLERNYLPFTIGEHLFHWTSRQWSPQISDPMLSAHMEAYLDRLENLKLEFERERNN